MIGVTMKRRPFKYTVIIGVHGFGKRKKMLPNPVGNDGRPRHKKDPGKKTRVLDFKGKTGGQRKHRERFEPLQNIKQADQGFIHGAVKKPVKNRNLTSDEKRSEE